jgi:hypothetical protein
MKKLTVLIFALLSFFINESSGQNSKFEIGSEGGAGLISLRGDSLFSYDAALGFTGGISFQYNISGLFSLRTNISDSDVSLKNNSLSLLAGVAYRFGMSTN